MYTGISRQLVGDMAQYQIANPMPEIVIDLLEVVQINEQQSHLTAPLLTFKDCLLQPFGKQPPVGQPGQGIVMGVMV